MSKIGEVFEKNSSVFDKFTGKEWISYYTALNEEKSADECGLKLSDDEKVCYNEALEKLKKERERCPEVSYEIKYSWFE